MAAEETIGPVVARQFDRAWSTLRDAISRLDEQQWRSGSIDLLIPARLAQHLVESAEFYSSDADPLEEQWDQLQSDWQRAKLAQLPSKAQLLAYLSQVQAKLRVWLLARTDKEMLGPQSMCDWTGPTLLDRALYTMRYVQHHVAQINAELRRRGLPPGEWV